MRNYKFSLETVLEVRTDKEKNILEDFVLVQNALMEEESRMERLQNKLMNFLSKKGLKMNVRDLTMSNLYKVDLEEKIESQDRVVNGKKEELEKAREKLQEAQKDKKIMEKLKEKDYGRYKDKLEKKNQKELDEFAVLRYDSGAN